MTDYRNDDSYWVRKARRTAENALLKKRVDELEESEKSWKEEFDIVVGERNKTQTKLDAVQDILDGIEEINPSNYDHELVCQMNSGVVELFGLFDWEKGR